MTEQVTTENPYVPLRFKEYTDKALSYRLETSDATYALYNLPAEVGELLGFIAKHRRDGPYSPKKDAEFRSFVKKEIGDILWCLGAIADDFNATLEECALINLVKLRDRKERGVIQGSGDER